MWERLKAAECMFQPHLVDVGEPGVADLSQLALSYLALETLSQTIQSVAPDVRPELYKRIELSSMYPGLLCGLEKEMKQLYLTNVLRGNPSRLNVRPFSPSLTDCST